MNHGIMVLRPFKCPIQLFSGNFFTGQISYLRETYMYIFTDPNMCHYMSGHYLVISTEERFSVTVSILVTCARIIPSELYKGSMKKVFLTGYLRA